MNVPNGTSTFKSSKYFRSVQDFVVKMDEGEGVTVGIGE